MKSGVDVSIVMPCLNEETTVAQCVRKAQKWISRSGFQGEVIVVDNGSSDQSAQVAAASGAKVVQEPQQGYGKAYLRGLKEARGRYMVLGDSDDTYDFSNLWPLVRPLEEGFDLVLGNRYKGGIHDGAMPWLHRHVGNPVLNLLLRLCGGTKIGDSQSGLRALTRTAYQRLRLRSGGMEFASEMILNAGRRGLRVMEVPIRYYPRRGESKLRTFRDGWRHLRFLLVSTPNILFTVPGVLLMLLGAFTLLLSLVIPSGFDVGSFTWQPVFASAIFLTIGTNAVVLGVVSRLYASARGLIGEDVWVRLYRRYIKLETLLGISVVLVIAGALLDAFLFGTWVFEQSVPRKLQLAAMAQSFLIIGANTGLAGFLAVMTDADQQ